MISNSHTKHLDLRDNNEEVVKSNPRTCQKPHLWPSSNVNAWLDWIGFCLICKSLFSDKLMEFFITRWKSHISVLINLFILITIHLYTLLHNGIQSSTNRMHAHKHTQIEHVGGTLCQSQGKSQQVQPPQQRQTAASESTREWKRCNDTKEV